MIDVKLMGKIEAVLFASGDPIDSSKLIQILRTDKKEFNIAIEGLKKKYDKNNSGITLLELDSSYQLSNKPEFGDYIKQAMIVKKNAPLSTAAMEVLAIIAYNQPEPVTKSFVEQIRGVDSSQTVNSLVEKGLVEEAGRHNLPGRPIVYRTTDVFLRNFGISNVTELPPLPTNEEQIQLNTFEQLDVNGDVVSDILPVIPDESEDTENIEKSEVFRAGEITENIEDTEISGDSEVSGAVEVDENIELTEDFGVDEVSEDIENREEL